MFDRAVACGIVYELAAYIGITAVLVHMFLIGLPIALITRKDLR